MAQAHELYSMYQEAAAAADPRHDLRARVLRRPQEEEAPPQVPMLMEAVPQMSDQQHSLPVLDLHQLPAPPMNESHPQQQQELQESQDSQASAAKKAKTMSNKPVWAHTYVQNGERFCRHCNGPLSVHSTRIRRHLLELCRMISEVDKQNLLEETQRAPASTPRSERPRKAAKPASAPSTTKVNKNAIIKEVLRHTTVTDADNKLRVCNYCNSRIAFDHPARIRKHILSRCGSVPANIKFYLYGLYSNSVDMPPPPFPRRRSSKNEDSSSSESSWSESSDESDGSESVSDSERDRRRSIARARKTIIGQMIHGSQQHTMDPNSMSNDQQIQYQQYQNSQGNDFQYQYPQQNVGNSSGDGPSTVASASGGNDEGLPLNLDGLKEYVERLDQMIAGLCRIRTRVCRSILTRHRSETEFRNAITDLKKAVDKGIRANMVI